MHLFCFGGLFFVCFFKARFKGGGWLFFVKVFFPAMQTDGQTSDLEMWPYGGIAYSVLSSSPRPLLSQEMSVSWCRSLFGAGGLLPCLQKVVTNSSQSSFGLVHDTHSDSPRQRTHQRRRLPFAWALSSQVHPQLQLIPKDLMKSESSSNPLSFLSESKITSSVSISIRSLRWLTHPTHTVCSYN